MNNQQNVSSENIPLRQRVRLLEKEAQDNRVRVIQLMTLVDNMIEQQKQMSLALLRLTEPANEA